MSIGPEPVMSGILTAGATDGSCAGGGDPNVHNDYPFTAYPLGTQRPTCTVPCSCDEQSGGAGGGYGILTGGSGKRAGDGRGRPGQCGPGSPGWPSCRLIYVDDGGGASSTGGSGNTLWPLAMCEALPSGPLRCVHPDTLVALHAGGHKRAGDVAPGDVLRSLTPDGQLVGEAVAAVVTADRPRMVLLLENGSRLCCSYTHELVVESAPAESGGTLAAERIGLRDRVLVPDGSFVGLRSIERATDGPVVQIALTGPNHVYVTDGFVSHNYYKTNPED